jgi:O-glycosyl hydrolase
MAGYPGLVVRASLVIALALAGIGSVVAASGARGGQSAESSTVVRVDLGARRQVMQGFGSSVRVWSDPHLSKSPKTVVPADAQAAILTALYRRLGLTRSRQSLDGGIESGPGGPFDFAGKLGEAQAAYIRQAKQYGLRTFFPAPVYAEDWMSGQDVDGYVGYAMGILRYWRSKGVEPPFYSVLNEPQITGDFPPQWMHDVVLQLGRRMRSAGIQTKLVIPDDENPGDAYRRAVAVLQDPEARSYVGAIAYHVYRDYSDIGEMRALAAKYGLPLWMTEYQNDSYLDWSSAFPWAVRVNDLITNGGVSAVDYLWGFFGSWVRTDTMISIDFDNGVYRSFSYTPIYWITGQFSRFVRPGYRRVATTPASGAVLSSAYSGAGKAVVVLINPGSQATTSRVVFAHGRLRGPVTAVRSSASERWHVLPRVALKGSTFSTTLPPLSVTTFVAKLR